MSELNKREFGQRIGQIMQGRNLSREDSREMFRQVLLDAQPALQQGAFLAAMTAKGETAEEIAGAWEAIYEMDTVKVKIDLPIPLVENSGTGMDALKTFNISTAAALVAAANGVPMARHGARALTSNCGTVDILEALGVDVECDVVTVKKSIEETGIGVFNGMSARVHPQALFRILSQISFGTTLNIAGSLSNPALPACGLRGVHSAALVEPVLKVMREIGYKKAIVVHGMDESGQGMDEISTLGETILAELDETGRMHKSTIRPEDFGVRRACYAELASTADRCREAREFIRVISGKRKDARTDIVCLNAAPLFYLAGQAATLQAGFQMACTVLEKGLALAKLRQWVAVQNCRPQEGCRKLEKMIVESLAA